MCVWVGVGGSGICDAPNSMVAVLLLFNPQSQFHTNLPLVFPQEHKSTTTSSVGNVYRVIITMYVHGFAHHRSAELVGLNVLQLMSNNAGGK